MEKNIHAGMSIAVIIPAYNAAPFIAEAVCSVLQQSRPADQVVVVDDGSTDGTAACVEPFADAVILLRQSNAGVCAARNLGAAQTIAEWLLFLDADDRLTPDALAQLAAHTTEASAVYGKALDFTAEDHDLGTARGDATMEGSPPSAAARAFWKAPISTPGVVLIHRAAFEQAGGWNERFNTTADRDLWCRLGVHGRFTFVDQVIVERRMHGANMSADKNRARRQAVEVQFAFLEWCAERGIETAFLETSVQEILDRNAARALEERAWEAASWLVKEAAMRNIATPGIERLKRLAAMPIVARELELWLRSFFS